MSAVALLGNVSIDRHAGGAPRPGGAVTYGGLAAAAAGLDVRIATRCTAADRALALAPLERTGLPLLWREAAVTTAFSYNYEDGSRRMVVDGIGDTWNEADLSGWAAPALERATWVHVGALLRSHFPAATLRAARRNGRSVLVDAQGLVRVAQLGPLQRDADVDPAALAAIDALKLSESEARLLAGGVEVEHLRAIGVPEVLLTLGAAGSLVVTPTAAERITVAPVDTRDPTGAGDTYALGYAAARAAGAEPIEAARRASDLVSRVLAARR
jgi:sugar/nucleoside kinase (ribokinase family)